MQDEGQGEDDTASGNGRVVLAPLPSQFDDDLNKNTDEAPPPDQGAAALISNLRKRSAESKQRLLVRDGDLLQPVDTAFLLEGIQLSGGGRSINRAFTFRDTDSRGVSRLVNGHIVDGGGTLLPASGDGFVRVSPDRKAYGTAYSISFIMNVARAFAAARPDCGPMVVKNISNKNGGILYFDSPSSRGVTRSKSHQNGLDFDIAYAKLSQLSTVVSGNHVTSEFDDDCNYARLKYLTNLYFSDESLPYVNLVLVHTVVKKHLCDIKKAKGYNSLEDDHMMSVIHATPDEHQDHEHVRLNCSPLHQLCKDDYSSPQPCP
jgi:murein endopeptidase